MSAPVGPVPAPTSRTPTTTTTTPADDGGAAWSTRAERWLRYDGPVRQGTVSLVVSVLCLEYVDTADDGALRVWAYVLVLANILVLSTRILPRAVVDRIPPLPLYVVGGLLAAALLVVDRSATAPTFAFLITGNIGFQRPYGQALTLSTLISGSCVVAIAIGHAQGWVDFPWYVGALTGVSVLLGIANRSRALAVAGMQAAAKSALAAAKSEARAQTMAERARIARDVHDVLAHSLAGINMQLEVVDALLESGDSDAARLAAQRAQKQVREGLAEVSRTVHTLREDALPLVDTLTSLVGAAAPPGTALEVVGTRREVPTRQATALARVAQESLTNARKHAPDADVRVTLTFGPTATALEVVNGRPSRRAELTDTGSGMGLVGMRERIEIVGGSVQTGPIVEGGDAGGWRVHVEVPA